MALITAGICRGRNGVQGQCAKKTDTVFSRCGATSHQSDQASAPHAELCIFTKYAWNSSLHGDGCMTPGLGFALSAMICFGVSDLIWSIFQLCIWVSWKALASGSI
jgi:hypothetical protein